MKKWFAYCQLNGEDVSQFIDYEFDVTNKLYQQIQTAIEQNIPLTECDFYSELVRRADRQFDIDDYLDFDDYEKPMRAEYDSSEEYREALDEYNNEIEEYRQQLFSRC